jgi:hypothetical protein
MLRIIRSLLDRLYRQQYDPAQALREYSAAINISTRPVGPGRSRHHQRGIEVRRRTAADTDLANGNTDVSWSGHGRPLIA